MAASAWSSVAAHSEGYTRHFVLGRNLHHHHSPYRSVHALFYKLDLHHEFYNAVWESIPMFPYVTSCG